MGENKKTRIKLEGWLERIAIHAGKIAEELAKPGPNMGRVVGWDSEIRTAKKAVFDCRSASQGARNDYCPQPRANPGQQTVKLRAKLEVVASILKSHAYRASSLRMS